MTDLIVIVYCVVGIGQLIVDDPRTDMYCCWWCVLLLLNPDIYCVERQLVVVIIVGSWTMTIDIVKTLPRRFSLVIVVDWCGYCWTVVDNYYCGVNYSPVY